MLSLYRAWLGPSPCVARPAPPPGAHRPVPRRAKAPSPPSSPRPASPSSTTSSELDVEHVESPVPAKETSKSTVLDIASCDGPVRFSRVLNSAWRERPSEPGWCRLRKPRAATVQYYPCKTCGSKFPSYYFVHKHRKRCHADEAGVSAEPEHEPAPDPGPSTSTAATATAAQ